MKREVAIIVVAAATCLPALAAAQDAAGRDHSFLWVRLAAGLLLCIFIAVAAVVLLKRFSGKLPRFGFSSSSLGVDQSLRVLETRRLSLHADACRLVSGDREYLVIVSSGAIAVLKETQVAQEGP